MVRMKDPKVAYKSPLAQGPQWHGIYMMLNLLKNLCLEGCEIRKIARFGANYNANYQGPGAKCSSC